MSDGYNSANGVAFVPQEENGMRTCAWLIGLFLLVVLLALPRAVYACPS